MDPNECLRLMMEAMKDDDREGVAEHAANLLTWLDNGGFEPAVITEFPLRELCAYVMRTERDAAALRSSVARWEARVIKVDGLNQRARRLLEGKTE